jgi:nitronate monooxygenase
MTLQQLLGVQFPIIQAPTAGSRASELAIAVSNAGGLGSLPCALLNSDAMQDGADDDSRQDR